MNHEPTLGGYDTESFDARVEQLARIYAERGDLGVMAFLTGVPYEEYRLMGTGYMPDDSND